MNETSLTDLQHDNAEALRADEVLSALAILDEEKGDLLSAVQTAMGEIQASSGKFGACVIVLSPVCDDANPDTPGGPLDAKVAARVLCDPVVNNDPNIGTGIKALTICRRIHRVWKHRVSAGLCQAMVPDRPCIVPVGDPLAPVAYEVRFTTTEADAGTWSKVASPVIVVAGGFATVTCATAGAAVYVTTDGSFPRSGNGTAVLYAAPVAVTAGQVVRAAGYKAGSVGSNVARTVA